MWWQERIIARRPFGSPAGGISTITPPRRRAGVQWDAAAARHALDFFGHLRHSTGEWRTSR